MLEVLLGLWVAMNDHGRMLLQRGKAPEAAIQFRAAAAIASETMGPDHPVVAMILRNLSLAYCAEGLPRKAESTARRSRMVLESHYGPNDPALTPSLNALGEALAAQNRWTEARRVFERAVRLDDRGVHGATALHNLAAAHQSEGQALVALRFYRQALARREAILGPTNAATLATRTALYVVGASGSRP
jgi:eukaryotic-like serine/threonine-protein kinase